jgi:hypothetical protein
MSTTYLAFVRRARLRSIVRALSIAALLAITGTVAFAQAREGRSEPTNPRRGLVLLMGVASYQPGTFSDLKNPCRDVDALAQAVEARSPDLSVYAKVCDGSADTMRSKVGDFMDALADLPSGSFGILYFVGHAKSILPQCANAMNERSGWTRRCAAILMGCRALYSARPA